MEKITTIKEALEKEKIRQAWGNNELNPIDDIKNKLEYHTIMLLDIYERLAKLEKMLREGLYVSQSIRKIREKPRHLYC